MTMTSYNYFHQVRRTHVPKVTGNYRELMKSETCGMKRIARGQEKPEFEQRGMPNTYLIPKYLLGEWLSIYYIVFTSLQSIGMASTQWVTIYQILQIHWFHQHFMPVPSCPEIYMTPIVQTANSMYSMYCTYVGWCGIPRCIIGRNKWMHIFIFTFTSVILCNRVGNVWTSIHHTLPKVLFRLLLTCTIHTWLVWSTT